MLRTNVPYLIVLQLILFVLSGCVLFDGETPPFVPTLCKENQRVESQTCVSCSPGTVNEAGDRKDAEDTTCEPLFCKVNERVSANQCIPCEDGQTNDAGDDASGSDTLCTKAFCKENEFVSAFKCLPCPKGERNDAGDDASGADTTCNVWVCEENQRVISNRCEACPAGTASPAGAQAKGDDTSCQPVICDENQFVQANQCSSCPAGTTRPAGDDASAGDTQCLPTLCGVNQFVQANRCVDCSGTQINEPGDDASGGDTQCVALAYSDVSVGAGFACALTVTGAVRCWGDNSLQTLGDDTQVGSSTPKNLVGLESGVTAIGTGESHACALLNTGKVMCWGTGNFTYAGFQRDGALKGAPKELEGIDKTEKLEVGGFYACVTNTKGVRHCWGEGLLTPGAARLGSMPTEFDGVSDIESMHLGYGNVCALLKDKDVWCWGTNQSGQLGLGFLGGSGMPTKVPISMSNVISVSVGSGVICALLDDKSIQCSGKNNQGQLGVSAQIPSSDVFIEADKVNALNAGQLGHVKQLEVGNGHSCVVRTDGGLYCWGSNDSGQLGRGTKTSKGEPALVRDLGVGVVKVSVSALNTCALMSSGNIKCWGDNSKGQLGDGTTTESLVPVDVLP